VSRQRERPLTTTPTENKSVAASRTSTESARQAQTSTVQHGILACAAGRICVSDAFSDMPPSDPVQIVNEYRYDGPLKQFGLAIS
jgi:hypothetical protein